MAVAALSLAAPSVPDSDPWGWVIWGRQLDHLDLVTVGYPSWKPLPAIVTALWGLVGAAPAGWLVVVRAGGLASLVLAYRMAARYGGRTAGVVAAAGIVLFPAWLRFLAHGTSEPLLIAFVLGAVESHLRGRRWLAFGLGLLAGLLRPEVWPFVFAYVVVLRPPTTGRRLLAALCLAAMPLLWFVPDWIGSGSPWHGAHIASMSGEASATRASGHPLLEVLQRGGALVVAPIELLALVGIVLAWRRREAPVLVLTGLALSWVGLVLVMTALGFAGIARFLEPAGALVCVLGGIGAGWLVGPRQRVRSVRVAGALALAAGLPFVAARAPGIVQDAHEVRAQATIQQELGDAVRRLGGPRAVLAYGRPTATPDFQTSLAWDLGLSTDAVARLRAPAVVFRAAAKPFPAFEHWRAARFGHGPRRLRRLLHHGRWDVLLGPREPRAGRRGFRTTGARPSARRTLRPGPRVRPEARPGASIGARERDRA